MKEEATNLTFAESILGKSFFEDPLVKRVLGLSATWKLAGTAALLAAVLFVPFLGAVGLWDPWETHYGEVARQMIHRGDYVYEYWENGWFFSKPAMTMWLMALGMNLVGATDVSATGYEIRTSGFLIALWALLLLGSIGGALYALKKKQKTSAMYAGGAAVVLIVLAIVRAVRGGGDTTFQPGGALSVWTEWGMRLPFVTLSIVAVALLSLAVGRVVSRRAGLATGFVLSTMPMYFLITRQAVTDTPFVTAMTSAMACALIGQLDESTKRRAAWWYGFYVFCGLGTLAKGLPALVFPAAILLIYAALCVIPWDGNSLWRHVTWFFSRALVPAGAGVIAGAVVGGISYVLMVDAYSGDDRNGFIARGVAAGLLGFLGAIATFVVLLNRRLPNQMEMPTLWAQFFRMRLGTGILVYFAVVLPWYLTLTLFESVGNAEEGQLFWYRFFIHDHVNRMFAGVHTTTPGGTFIYFIEQGGFAIFPWVALVPGALAIASRVRLRGGSAADHLTVIAAVWVAFTFTFLGMSSTKFHHYVFPVLPGLAILIALFIDKLWEEGIPKHAVLLIFGLGLMILVAKDLASNPKNFTDLFVYNYERPYPQELVNKPITLFNIRSLWWGDLGALLLLAFGGYLTFDAFTDKAKPVLTRALGLLMLLSGAALLLTVWLRGRASPSLLLGLAVFGVAVYFVYLALQPGNRDDATKAWVATAAAGLISARLLVRGMRLDAKDDPLLPRILQTVNTKEALGFAFGVAILLLVVAAAMRARTMLFGTFWALAFGFAAWFSWSHWVDLSHHWTQRDLFWKYYSDRKPGEPITAFLMNWRGETFYSQNTVRQIKDNQRMTQYAAQPGREWALVEHYRLGILKSAVGPGKTVTVQSTAETNNKFVLVTID